MNCKKCQSNCIKKGFNKLKQKYYCKSCRLYQQNSYVYHICSSADKIAICKLTCIGVGISGIANYTGMSKANVVNVIRKMAKKISIVAPNETHQTYEIDEMYTFVKHKSKGIYLIYALNSSSKQVIDFVVGARTKLNIKKVIDTILALHPKKVLTDKLNIYPMLE